MPQSDFVENGKLVDQMYRVVQEGGRNIKHIPYWIEQVIETEAWRVRWTGAFTVRHASFRNFIVTPPYEGMGWSSEEDFRRIESLLREAPDVLRKWRELTKLEAGANQHTEVGDHKSAEQGTSLGYTLSRLHRDHPKLYAKVLNKQISANAAAIAAGFRKQPSALQQMQKLWRRLTPAEQRAHLIWGRKQIERARPNRSDK